MEEIVEYIICEIEIGENVIGKLVDMLDNDKGLTGEMRRYVDGRIDGMKHQIETLRGILKFMGIE